MTNPEDRRQRAPGEPVWIGGAGSSEVSPEVAALRARRAKLEARAAARQETERRAREARNAPPPLAKDAQQVALMALGVSGVSLALLAAGAALLPQDPVGPVPSLAAATNPRASAPRLSSALAPVSVASRSEEPPEVTRASAPRRSAPPRLDRLDSPLQRDQRAQPRLAALTPPPGQTASLDDLFDMRAEAIAPLPTPVAPPEAEMVPEAPPLIVRGVNRREVLGAGGSPPEIEDAADAERLSSAISGPANPGGPR